MIIALPNHHKKTTADKIFEHYEKNQQPARPHLGASEIGKSCPRAIWYNFRWASEKKFSGRILRLFKRGQNEESSFINDLLAIGVEIHEVDPETGKQFSFSRLGGHFSGSADGVAKGFIEAPKSWAVVEFKTHSSKSFKELERGVEQAKPEHFIQMQVYMGMLGIERAMYLAVNKDNDEIYNEWVYFNEFRFNRIFELAEKIITSSVPLERLSNDPEYFECRFCDHKSICHKEKIAEMSCRTCAFSTPDTSAGGWRCGFHKIEIPLENQRKGCASHLYIPNLISLEASDFKESAVVYKTSDGVLIENVMEGFEKKGGLCYTSEELSGANIDMITNPFLMDVKRLGGTLKDKEVKE